MDSTDIGCTYSMDDSYKSHSGTSLNYSTDINAISVDLPVTSDDGISTCSNRNGLKYLPRWPAVNLEFRDLSYSVSDANQGKKKILKNISGEFKSHELTAIMGPSGAGKTTLLNLLAGFGISSYSGYININRNPRDPRLFRKMSRYIMQNDIVDPYFTVMEAMMLAANLKLGSEFNRQQKLEIIEEILNMLRLEKTANTVAARLSGGERKRLCVAMELVNNPPVLFLDEPTTGLDDLSSSQCVSLLRRLAHSGRTIICSIHTPPAKLFQMFDKVYVLAEGQCVYQGSVGNIVPYLKEIGLSCPITYNPADFFIEVACREYGDYHKQMVNAIDNGNVYRWMPNSRYSEMKSISPTTSNTTSGASSGASSLNELEQFEMEIDKKALQSHCSWWLQYRILLHHMVTKMWRDKSYIKLRFYMNIILGLIVGGIYVGVGNDASKALFNFGFAFTIVIAYLYLPLMPVLAQFPTEMKLLKREYFNQWYNLSSYYLAMITSRFPYMFLLAVIYLTMVYLMSNQPLELFRFAMLFLVAILTAQISDSVGMLVSSRLSLVNAMFMGPVMAVPLILLSCYGIGYGRDISPFMRFIMNFSYLRHSMEALVETLYGYNRADTICPPTEVLCLFKNAKFLREILGYVNLNYWSSIFFLVIYYIVCTSLAFVLIKHRLSASNGATNRIFQYINHMLVKYLNFTTYKY
uniref:ABC-2 type transporter n=1 Tax=Musca domestica TaxID=7370 RepID=T1PBK3_MUSDO